MKRLVSVMLAAGAAFSLAMPAQAATTIDFDGLAAGDVVTNQFAGQGVTFSSEAGSQIDVLAQNLGSSLPNFICSTSCTSDIFVDFAAAVSGLTFLSIGADASGDVGDVRIFNGATLLGTVDIMANGTPFTADLVDLSAFAAITRIEIVGITDPAGLGFDDFTFNASNGAVPEPGTWAMMLLGFGAVGFAMRRRKPAERLLIA
jgi:hypothetical protein